MEKNLAGGAKAHIPVENQLQLNQDCFSLISRCCKSFAKDELSVTRSLTMLLLFLAGTYFPAPTRAQENPYIVTYDHYLEEPGNLEIEYFSTFGTQRGGNDYHAFWMEFEYGATAWWTTELYLDGQTTFNDSTLFTGFRWENRFRPLKREHFINPVLYVEYENINGADKILKEIEGHDVESDRLDPNAVLRQEHAHELEFKLILSSTFKGWNFAQNTIATKNLSNEPWEFGYALAASRPLALKASAEALFLLSGKFHRRRRNVWRPGRSLQFRPARNFSLPRARGGVESSLRLDAACLARLRPERQQRPFSAALGRVARNHRLRLHGQPHVRWPPMKYFAANKCSRPQRLCSACESRHRIACRRRCSSRRGQLPASAENFALQISGRRPGLC